MKAIILAAGASNRLRPLTDEIPKCLIRIGEKSILEYQLDAVSASGMKEAVIVVGYLKHMIQEYIGASYKGIKHISYIENPDYATTNTIYSLYLARGEFRGQDFIYFNADVLMHRDIVEGLVRHVGNNVLAVEYVSCGEEEVKFVTNSDNRIVKLGKYIPAEKAEGEFIGVAKFGSGITESFIEALARYARQGDRDLFFEKAVEDILDQDTFYPLDVTHIPSIEIDYPEDLEKAKEKVYPEIMRYGGSSDEMQNKLAYYIDASIHQIPSIAYIAYEAGGTIYTESELTFKYFREEHPSLDVQLCETVDEIRQRITAAGVKVLIHPDFSYKIFKKLPDIKHVQVFHGTSDKKYDYMKFVSDYDLFFISGEDAYERYRKKGLLKNGTGMLVGYPKLDRVFKGELLRDEELSRLGMDPKYKTVLYAPTWTDKELNSSWKRFREAIVKNKPDDINLIVKLHPNLKRYRAEEVERFRVLMESCTKTLLLDAVPDIVPFMAASDLLLGDVSSVTREYLAFRKPLIFLSTMPRCIWNRKKRHLWDCGRVVRDPDDVWHVVKEVFMKPEEYMDRINSHLQKTFYKPDGKASLRAKEAIYNLVSRSS